MESWQLTAERVGGTLGAPATPVHVMGPYCGTAQLANSRCGCTRTDVDRNTLMALDEVAVAEHAYRALHRRPRHSVLLAQLTLRRYRLTLG